jgi:hypothetical protein
MKRIFYAAAIIGSLFATKANAQYTLDRDTAKGTWGAMGYPVDTKVKVITTGSSTVNFNWYVVGYSDFGGTWKIGNICEPFGSCYGSTTTGLLSGATTFNCSVAGGSAGYFDVSFDGDAAPNNSYAHVTLNVNDGTTNTKPVFIAYKTGAGVATAILKEADVTIFPNPASTFIDVLYNPAADVKSITLYNLIGKVVNVYKVTDKNSAHCEFPVDMPSGIYIVRVADSRGNVIATRKITHQ